MAGNWELILQEIHPQASALAQTGGSAHGTLEFLTDNVITPDELISQARAIIEQNFYVLEASVYKPEGVSESRRWLATIAIKPKVEIDLAVQTEALSEELHTAGLLYRAQKEWFWDIPGDVMSTISGLIQGVMMIMVMAIMMPMMTNMMSSSNED